MISTNSRGQALIEFILLFGFLGFLAVNIFALMKDNLTNSLNSLNFVLTQYLSTGVCKEYCFYDAFVNRL